MSLKRTNPMRTSLIRKALTKKNQIKTKTVKKAKKIRKTKKSLPKRSPRSLKISLPHL